MADVRPFRALRYDAARIDPALTVAPPYDVISPSQQAELYRRHPRNVVRLEYGEAASHDTPVDNRYTRAARDLAEWRRDGALTRDAHPALYAYRQEYTWEGSSFARNAVFAAVRLEEWEKGVIKPHEHTLSGPKADRLELLRATRTQISPVYGLYRAAARAHSLDLHGQPLYDIESDGQRHTLTSVSDLAGVASFRDLIARSDVYIADGHHRYETALAYRDEARARAPSWTGDETENFVLMALTDVRDPGLLVLPTHRVVHRPLDPSRLDALTASFEVARRPRATVEDLLTRVAEAGRHATAFGLLTRDGAYLLTVRAAAVAQAAMPAAQPDAWKRLDVSVLQYGVLAPLFGIDDAALADGGVVTYTQDAAAAVAAVALGDAHAAFLLNATPVEQVLAVADAGGRMPQKSTYFYPKLPTGLVMNPLDP
ncbi:MAG TPA: DUF1015 domain-containing protein [Dehalococcoidia bacterium]|nr:DUF1015 domain-containing protein [Dehalococcoidia bacterium]